MEKGSKSTGSGYSITTYRFRLRCGHPEWLMRTQELYDGIVKFYYDLLLAHEELWGLGSQETLCSLEVLSLPGKEKRKPQTPLPWEGVPPYFRRAAINGGIAAVKSFLTRKKALDALNEKEMESSSTIRKKESSLRKRKTAGTGNGLYERGKYIPRAEKPAAEINSAVVYYSRMYRDFSPEHITLKVWDGKGWRWLGCRLSGRGFPPDARILSPSVVSEGAFFMLHVPVREPVRKITPVKERMRAGERICGIQFTNGDAFAVASICDADGKEIAVKFFNGGMEYSHHCRKLLEKISRSSESLGEFPEGPVNRKYWMHLKHLKEHYAHQVSREIVRFCEENQAGTIVLPEYQSVYVWQVMKTVGNWSPLQLNFRVRSYLRYKAWQSGILVVEVYARDTERVCAVCGRSLAEEADKSKEFVCMMGHRGNRYLNAARNLAVKCRKQFQERESG